jgi:hypothetical protein
MLDRQSDTWQMDGVTILMILFSVLEARRTERLVTASIDGSAWFWSRDLAILTRPSPPRQKRAELSCCSILVDVDRHARAGYWDRELA